MPLNSKYTHALRPLEDMLTSGGDARIVRNAQGVNKYGCFPVPQPDILSYGSCTASTISPAGFAASEALYQKLEHAAGTESASVTYAREMNRIRGELISLCDLTTLSGLDIVFGASGTDIHLFAAQLLCTNDVPLQIIMADASETGSGVPAALGGGHFSACTALGGVVAQGTNIAHGNAIDMAEIRSRADNGDLRPASDIDAEFEKRVADAVGTGRRVLLVLADLSKTGLVIPNPACALALRRRFSGRVDILVDACQFRLSRETIRAYLEQECLLAMTGSKFVTGPAFSGALLVPQSMAERLRGRPLPQALGLYSAQADWPDTWAARSHLPDAPNYGLLLRFEAVLAELRAFHSLPETDIMAFLKNFTTAIHKRLTDDPVFEPLPVRQLNREFSTNTWDQLPTIFPFRMRHLKSGALLGHREITHIYERLVAQRCQLGQPVACGALRLCVDMRLVVDAVQGRGSNAVIAGAMHALDKAAALGKELPVTA